MEYEQINDQIYSQTNTVDDSFNNVKGIGNVSGVTLTVMWFGAWNAGKEKEEIFGWGLQRRYNLLASLVAGVNSTTEGQADDLDVSIIFNYSIPRDEMQKIESIMMATGGEPILTQESGAEQNPLVTDAPEEVKKLKEQRESRETERTFEG